MKFVVVSDLHHDWVTCGVPRGPDVEKALLQSVIAAVKEKVDGFFFLGDLCDPDEAPTALRAVRVAMEVAAELARHSIPSFWLAGNHDVVEDGSGDTTLSPMRVLGDPCRVGGLVHVLERPSIIYGPSNGLGFNVLALPFTPNSRRYDPRLAAAGGWKVPGPTIVVGHLSIPGIQPGEETTEMPRGREVAFPFAEVAKVPDPKIVLSGHYHRRQRFVAPNGLVIHVVGSLARLTFAEEHNDPGFLVVDL